MTLIEVLQTAAAKYGASPTENLVTSLSTACIGEDPSYFLSAVAAILNAAGIAPDERPGPYILDQLVAWSKIASRDDVIATMQRAAA